jgi:hypothetical protein
MLSFSFHPLDAEKITRKAVDILTHTKLHRLHVVEVRFHESYIGLNFFASSGKFVGDSEHQRGGSPRNRRSFRADDISTIPIAAW